MTLIKKWVLPLLVVLILFVVTLGRIEPISDRIKASSWNAQEEASDVLIKRALEPAFGDLPAIGERQVLRVLVSYSRTNYYLDRGHARGIASDLGRAFGEQLARDFKIKPSKLQVVFVPTTPERMLDMLQEGRGDIAIGSLPSVAGGDIVMSEPFISNGQWVYVGNKQQSFVNRLEDLQNREVAVRRSSRAYQELLQFNDWLVALDLSPMQIQFVDEQLDDEDVLELVDAGVYAGTISLDYVAKLWARSFDNLRVAEKQPLKSDVPIGWAVRKDSPLLLAQSNRFIAGHRVGTNFGNQMLARYFGEQRNMRAHLLASEKVRYGSMVDLFKRYGEQYQLNWMLLLAQGFQESGLNQSARSSRGAVGVMQVLPSTAQASPINIRNVQKLESNIHAGAKYMAHLRRDYFNDPAIAEIEQHLFALAAYNAGPTRIQKLREQAAREGLDPNRWHNHVEVVVARKVGSETTTYVNNIYKYYISYRRLEDAVAVREKIKTDAMRSLMQQLDDEQGAQLTVSKR